jgi:EmrB/QacA subfamily drug resistance transporter
MLVCISLSQLLANVNTTNLNFAIPTIASDFGLTFNIASWGALSYLLFLSAFLPLVGKIADLIGYKKILLIGNLLMGIGSALCYFSDSLFTLITYRALMATGGAIMAAMGPAIVTRFLPAKSRGRSIGFLHIAITAGILLGVSFGGFLTSTFGWRSIFFLNVIIVLVTTSLTVLSVPGGKDNKEQSSFDYIGSVLCFAAISSLVVGLTLITDLGLSSRWTLGVFAAAVFFIFGMIFWERRISDPIIDIHFFFNRKIATGILSFFLQVTALFGTLFILPIYLEKIRGLNTGLSSLMMALPIFILIIVLPVSGHISDHYGQRGLAFIGMLLGTLFCLILSTFGMTTNIYLIILEILFIGSAHGLYAPPTHTALLNHAPANKIAATSSMITMTVNIGALMGVALFNMIFLSTLPDTGLDQIAPELLKGGFTRVFRFAALLCLISAISITFLQSSTYKKASA